MLGKRNIAQVEQLLHGVLDFQDAEVVLARTLQGGEVLFMNETAGKRLAQERQGSAQANIFEEYCKCFPALKPYCERENPPVGPVELTDRQGRAFSLAISQVVWVDGKPATLFILRDVQEERDAQQRYYNLAFIDALTGIPNRQKLREDFEAAAGDIAAGAARGALAIFDLDHFKNINDTYGHATGDMMLRRLTEHFQDDPELKNHLYRLGGDEFVFLYVSREPVNPKDENGQRKYAALFQGALRAYTMPTIELSCTISMGISLFPAHGDSFSELLRKADIALYEAKAAGRNQIVFFEDRFDTAKKFRDVFVNIQPILVSSGHTFGYELLDKGNADNGEEENIALTESDRTLDVIELGDLENSARYFISYSNHLADEAVLRNLPKNKFVIQIQAFHVHSDIMLRRFQKLRGLGYSIAASGLNSLNATPELLSLVDYAKFSAQNATAYFREKTIRDNPKKIFIATNVDTGVQFETAKRQGFKLFQGFFFNNQPVVKRTKEIDPLRVNYVRLLKLASTDDYVNFKEISSVIASDVALSYKLLRILNSAAVGLRNITSINMAVTYLGEDNLKKWVALLALRGVSSSEPLELVRTSLIRARFGELLAPYFRIRRDPNQLFLLGLLSLLHIALDKTKEEVLEEIPVADDIRQSLLGRDGPYSDCLTFFSNYEYGNWDEVTRFGEENFLGSQVINDCYIKAVKWYNDLDSE